MLDIIAGLLTQREVVFAVKSRHGDTNIKAY
ncbi:MAG: hypothetical protein JWQ57_3947 [Mucilaginibacter sp.]|nr:hypothetical protein [Mucilaginibacter sp.]